jgi:hypothetical protein
MAKDKKGKSEGKKAKLAEKKAKQEKKGEKKEKAKASKSVDSDAEDVDLDAVLAEYAKKQEQFLKVTEAPCDPPKARASATLIASPANENELFLFGGEYFNGALATFFNDLYVYVVSRDEWRLVTSPNTPLPRSGHAWCRGGNAGGIYLFGGEFSSPKQGTFYHYNDVSPDPFSLIFYYMDADVDIVLALGALKQRMDTHRIQRQNTPRPQRPPNDLLQELHHSLRWLPRYIPTNEVPSRSLDLRHAKFHLAPTDPPTRNAKTRRQILILVPPARTRSSTLRRLLTSKNHSNRKTNERRRPIPTQHPQANGPPRLLFPPHHAARSRRTLQRSPYRALGTSQEAR